MRFCFLLERGSPPRLNPILAEVFNLLEARGDHVAVRFPEEELLRLDTLRVDADLYLLKSDTELALSLATALENIGARVLNRCDACLRAKDKVIAAAILQNQSIPSPRSFAAAQPLQLAGKLTGGPLIMKPYRGYHGAGIEVAETAGALPSAEVFPNLVFAQEYLARARKDLKVYAIGGRMFGVRKTYARDSYLRAGALSPLSSAVDDIARRCGDAFGLELYGIDIAEDENGPYVVDVNYFPGYRGVPDAAQLLTEYVISAAMAG